MYFFIFLIIPLFVLKHVEEIVVGVIEQKQSAYKLTGTFFLMHAKSINFMCKLPLYKTPQNKSRYVSPATAVRF